jgi:hypothetical protein
VGVLIAALVAAYEKTDEEVKSPPAEPDLKPRPLPPPPPVRDERLGFRFDIGGALHASLDEDNPQPGALGRASLHFKPWPVFALTTLSYTQRVRGEPQVTWLAGSLGFGVRLGLDDSWFALELRSEAALERLFVKATERDSGRDESGAEWRLGPRLGVDALLRLHHDWQFFFGGQGSILRPEVVIEVQNAEVTRVPAAGWALLAGFRFAP